MKPSSSLSLLGPALLALLLTSVARSEVLVDFGVNSTSVEADISTYPSIVRACAER